MNNHYLQDSDGEVSNNRSSTTGRHEVKGNYKLNSMTGDLPPLTNYDAGKSHTGGFDFEQMVQSMHDLFEHDRQTASQTDATRCGICYLHYHLQDLHYRDEEGFYICSNCDQTLGTNRLPMVRRQQKL
ncbi:MAG TPA: hypothetical protein VL461_00805 [Dictyobacter sp.]|nr:hypothetical protein [Dictyobacter sp.]